MKDNKERSTVNNTIAKSTESAEKTAEEWIREIEESRAEWEEREKIEFGELDEKKHKPTISQ